MSIVLSQDQVKLCQSLAEGTVDALWAKNGVVDLNQQLMAKKQGVASNLTALYREAEKGTTPEARVELFARLCECFEAACIKVDAEQNKGNKRTVFEIYPSWRVMKSEMKSALTAGIPSVTSAGKPLTYGQIKDARKKASGPKGANNKAPKAPKVEVTPALGAALLRVQEYVVTLDATAQTDFAGFLLTSITRHKANSDKTINADITTKAQPRKARAAKAAA